MTTKDLKNIVEKYTGIEDISLRTNAHNISHARWMYFSFCRKYFEHLSLGHIGHTVGVNHATVIHGLKKINDELERGVYKYQGLYDIISEYLDEVMDYAKIDNKFTSVGHAIEYYSLKIHQMKNNHTIKVKELKERIDEVNNLPFAKDIVNLPKRDVEELSNRIETFLKVKKALV